MSDSLPGRPRAGRLPLLPIAPVIVAVVAIATAVTIALVAAAQLQQTSDEEVALRSKALAATVAARMRGATPEQRPLLLAASASRTGAAFLLVEHGGAVIADQASSRLAHSEVLRLLDRAEGVTQLGNERVRFAAASVNPPLEHLSVMAFVAAPSPAVGTIGMSNAVAVLTLLLLGVAIAVALVFMRAARDDVVFVRQRIADMARGAHAQGGAVGGDRVPVRSIDQVGVVTAALNVLIARFAAAERSYRADLRQAAQLNNERSHFLAGLSHELRTPLNAILGFTHLLESDDEQPWSADALESLHMIGTSGEHLKALIDDILDLSAMETGQLRLSRTLVDVCRLAQEVVREARATVVGKPIVLSVVESAHSYAWADARRTRQILTNLVSNAVKATRSGTISVSISKGKGTVSLTVQDSGRGIDPNVLDKIFEPYQQAGDAAARRGGAGLGLAITKRLVLLHDGSIEARSKLGKGSIFSVTLPDETQTTRLPRDSLVPWSETDPLLITDIPSSSRRDA